MLRHLSTSHLLNSNLDITNQSPYLDSCVKTEPYCQSRSTETFARGIAVSPPLSSSRVSSLSKLHNYHAEYARLVPKRPLSLPFYAYDLCWLWTATHVQLRIYKVRHACPNYAPLLHVRGFHTRGRTVGTAVSEGKKQWVI
jgi:hypothetical protein